MTSVSFGCVVSLVGGLWWMSLVGGCRDVRPPPMPPSVDAGSAVDAGALNDDGGVARCAASSAAGQCPGRRVCQHGACVVPLDDGVAKDASASTAWRNIWRSYRDRYAAFAAKPDLDWEQVRETFAADVDDAVTQVQAEWAISRGVQALQDGHVFVRPPRLCALDPGFGASQSNVDACVEETDEGLVVAKVGPTNPMGSPSAT